MSFGNSCRQFFTKWNDFKTRANRLDVFASWVIFFVVSFVYGFIVGFVNALSPGGGAAMAILILFAITYLALLVPGISVVVRRFHDVGLSGWWYLAVIVLIAVITVIEQSFGIPEVISWILAIIFNIMLVAIPGNQHSNVYGEIPSDLSDNK